MKTHKKGPVHFNANDGVSPVFVAYRFEFPNIYHELFIFDEDDNRYNLKGEISELPGVLVYLPSNKRYFINTILHTTSIGRTEYFLGNFLPTFRPTDDRLLVVGQFIASPSDKPGEFRVTPMNKTELKLLKRDIEKRYKVKDSNIQM